MEFFQFYELLRIQRFLFRMGFFQLFQLDRIQYISFRMEYIQFLIQLQFIQRRHDVRCERLNVLRERRDQYEQLVEYIRDQYEQLVDYIRVRLMEQH